MNDAKQDPEQKRDAMANGMIERRSGLVPGHQTPRPS